MYSVHKIVLLHFTITHLKICLQTQLLSADIYGVLRKTHLIFHLQAASCEARALFPPISDNYSVPFFFSLPPLIIFPDLAPPTLGSSSISATFGHSISSTQYASNSINMATTSMDYEATGERYDGNTSFVPFPPVAAMACASCCYAQFALRCPPR